MSDHTDTLIAAGCMRERDQFAKTRDQWPVANDYQRIVTWSRSNRRTRGVTQILLGLFVGGLAVAIYFGAEGWTPGSILFGVMGLIVVGTGCSDCFSRTPDIPALGIHAEGVVYFPRQVQIPWAELGSVTVAGRGDNERLELRSHGGEEIFVLADDLDCNPMQLSELILRMADSR